LSFSYLQKFLLPLVIFVAIIGLLLSITYAQTPAVIRHPQVDHYHFRLQVIINGKAEDFSKEPYQIPYNKGLCSADLPAQPFHFHDNKDQIAHVHWANMTGGLFLKYYGWNVMGGIPGALGYRFDNLPDIQRVSIHAKAFPDIPKDAHVYIYIGNNDRFIEKNFEDFKKQKLEDFFGKQSALHKQAQASPNLWDKLFPTAYAHNGVEDGHPDEVGDPNAENKAHTTPPPNAPAETPEEKLERINNLIGNAVIFVQKDQPSTAQVGYTP
jgi:hypothetical protein